VLVGATVGRGYGVEVATGKGVTVGGIDGVGEGKGVSVADTDVAGISVGVRILVAGSVVGVAPPDAQGQKPNHQPAARASETRQTIPAMDRAVAIAQVARGRNPLRRGGTGIVMRTMVMLS
jgi:hypothetical protein